MLSMKKSKFLRDLFTTVVFCTFMLLGNLATAEGYMLTSEIWVQVEIQTEEKGLIQAVWKKGGEAQTSRGDRVIWGHFYASSNDVSWGSQDNPDLFVKAWFDASGRIDVNYFHVSVPNIHVYSIKNGGDMLFSTTTMTSRYARHYFNHDGSQATVLENTDKGGIHHEQYGFSTATAGTQLNIRTEEKGNIIGVYREKGSSSTSRGDKVYWGYYFADPNDVSWGNQNNPEAFFKIWFDVSGRIDVNFFHVSVPEITVTSQVEGSGQTVKAPISTITLNNRYVRHEYSRGSGQGCQSLGTPSYNKCQTERLQGTWSFSFTITDTFTRKYTLTTVEENSDDPGEYQIWGTNEEGTPVLGGYVPTQKKFLLIDMMIAEDSTLTNIFTFEFEGDNTVVGCYDAIIDEGEPSQKCFSMRGTRISRSINRVANQLPEPTTENELIQLVKEQFATPQVFETEDVGTGVYKQYIDTLLND